MQGTQGGELGHPRWSPALPAGPAPLATPETRTAKASFCAMSKVNETTQAGFQGDFLLDSRNMKGEKNLDGHLAHSDPWSPPSDSGENDESGQKQVCQIA